ncbi:MAG: succinyl-diaminopimelate desuccinylase [Hyphomicrobiaceae bacterium]|nr:succinyl-diaminopimelate desuccinylase [Hyphomicrobiaceae bacterium]
MPNPGHDPIEYAQALIRCPSVTPEEAGALSCLEGLLAPAGFACHRLTMTEPGTPDVENLYARLGSGRPHLCFAGHTDVVPAGDAAGWSRPPFAADIVDGILYGRGAVDMKGAIACFAAAALAHIAGNGGLPRGSLSFLITGDEEGPGINGTAKILDWLSARGEGVDACLVGEPTSSMAVGDEVKIGRRGSVTVELTVHGKQGHAAYGNLADNPVPKLARIIDRLSSTPLDAGTSRFQPSSVEATVLTVPNTTSNVIPAWARAAFSIRYNDLHTRADIESWVRGHCEAVARELAVRFTLAFSGTHEVFLTEPGPLAEAVGGAVEAVTGRAPALTTSGGASDASFIHKLCPVVELGLRNSTAHKVDEQVPASDLAMLTAIYRHLIETYLG